MNLRLTVTAAIATAAASVALHPLIAGQAWFWGGAGAAVLVAAVGTATRLRPLPAIACLLAALGGTFLYLNALFAGPQSWARLVPTAASVDHLGWLVGRAMAESHSYAPPVPSRHGVLLLAVGGIGIVAAATDLLAVRLRRPAIAGLPLLVLYCVPLTIGAPSSGLGAALVFCLGMTGYLALLSAEGRERLRLWGRVVRTWHSRPETRDPDTRQLAAAGRRIGFAAVVISLGLPLLLPALAPHRLFASTGGTGIGSGSGGQITLPQPMVQMNTELRERRPSTVLTYRTTDATPPYLQSAVLTQLGTNAWTLKPPARTVPVGTGRLPAVPGLTSQTPADRVRTVHEDITISNSVSTGGPETYLPVPYAPQALSVPGRWRVSPTSLTILSAGTRVAGLHYKVTSYDINASQQELSTTASPPTSLGSYLIFPKVFRELRPLARRITAGRATELGKAVALQDWFTSSGRFTYTLRASEPRSADALINFLTTTRRGYCQQFAFAMAVMARLVGIPSRVAVGYTQGTFVGHDTWVVKTSDAHAWPELYFAGAGWLRFEPTPTGLASDPGQQTASVPNYAYQLTGPGTQASPQPGAPGGAGGQQNPGQARSHLPRRLGLPGGGEGGAAPVQAPGRSPPIGLLVVAALALLAVTPRATRTIVRRRRWLTASGDTERAHAAWREVRDDLADHRLACRASESPRAVARRLSRAAGLTGRDQQALDRITRAEERARYAITPVPSGQLRADVATVRRAIGRTVGLRARLLAMALPASVLARAGRALQNILDVFGWLDVGAARLRTRARRRREGTAAS